MNEQQTPDPPEDAPVAGEDDEQLRERLQDARGGVVNEEEVGTARREAGPPEP